MTTVTDTFIQHTEDILAVARRLLPRDIIVYVHECRSTHFGSWLVVAGRELERFQFRWDGRTLSLTISHCPLVDGRREWEPIHTLNVRHPEAVSAMETFLHEHFTPTA
jgi:hypothetical protein